jgi:hypothetical protein
MAYIPEHLVPSPAYFGQPPSDEQDELDVMDADDDDEEVDQLDSDSEDEPQSSASAHGSRKSRSKPRQPRVPGQTSIPEERLETILSMSGKPASSYEDLRSNVRPP